MIRRGVIGVVLGAALLCASPAVAHPVPFSYLDVRLHPGDLEATLVIHIFDLAHDLKIDPADRLLDPAVVNAHAREIIDLVRARLTLTAGGAALDMSWTGLEVLVEKQSVRLHARPAIGGSMSVLDIRGTLFPYDPVHQTFVNVYEGQALSQAILDRSRPEFEYFAGTRQGTFAVIRKFVPAGIHHILIGPDHILFLIGLLLLGGTWRRLALIVTGFTVAHSLTLSIAALGIFNPPPRLIEPAIALSIVYVGADNLLIRQGRDYRTWIAFGFGFIHGFGFASVLREMGLPARALGWSLFSFNAGVEMGQLLVVAVAATALAVLRARSETLSHRLAFAGSIVVMAVGAFWFVERVAFPGGL